MRRLVCLLLLAALAALVPAAIADARTTKRAKQHHRHAKRHHHAAAKPKADTGPALDVDPRTLRGALRCPGGLEAGDGRSVLLVHGTGTTGEDSWPDGLGIVLDNAHIPWCMVTIPGRETGDIQVSSEFVVSAVRSMHATTGAPVSLVGHSQGADLIRWPVRWWPDVRAAVDDVITVEGANQGVWAASGLCSVGSCAPAVWQYRIGSDFLRALNAVPTPAGPSYSAIGSQTDELLQPGLNTPTSTYRIPSPVAVNVQVQSICPGRVVTHGQAIFDAAELALVMDALTHPGPVVPSRVDRAVCSQLYAPGVDPIVATTTNASLYVGAAGPTILGRQVRHEPPLKPYAAGR
jgi:hypothetical protein